MQRGMVGTERHNITTTITMEVLTVLATWSRDATPAEHALVLGKVVYQIIECARRGVILWDSTQANWGYANGQICEYQPFLNTRKKC